MKQFFQDLARGLGLQDALAVVSLILFAAAALYLLKGAEIAILAGRSI
jgi:hypothetical protein